MSNSVEGKNVLFYVKDTVSGNFLPIGCELSNTFDENSEFIQTTTQDNEGWNTDLPTNQSYSMSVELMMLDDETGNFSYTKLRTLKRNRIKIEWKRLYLDFNKYETGFAHIESISAPFSVDDFVQISVQLKGFGKPNELQTIV